jgi:formylglycine-generating enzyme required for sulfatase activity
MHKVFISYSHKDEEWKDRLVTHLGVLRYQGLLDLWDDRRIAAGKDWHQEIKEAMATAHVAILLVSANFLTSEFILNQEIPHLLERRDKEGARIFPVIVEPCLWQAVGWLSRMQARPKDGRPLSAGNKHQIDTDLTAIAKEIYELLRLAGKPVDPPEPILDALQPEIRNSLGMELVLIPAGEFLMGSTDRQIGFPDGEVTEEDERPVHKVRISQPFYLGKYEVTQAQWEAVMGNNPSLFKGDPNRPVEHVSWEDVQKFIRWLQAREGDVHYRLPTEAEWEYACRAGSTTAYSFGYQRSRLDEYAWYDAIDTGGQTHPVGQLKPNAWGLYDMHGNVWEWVQDWYGEYPAEAVTNPQGPSSGSDRVRRGGSWFAGDSGWSCRSASRSHSPPDSRTGFLGFRLLRTAR